MSYGKPMPIETIPSRFAALKIENTIDDEDFIEIKSKKNNKKTNKSSNSNKQQKKKKANTKVNHLKIKIENNPF